MGNFENTKLFWRHLVGTVVIEEFCSFEVGSRGKWGVAIFWFFDVVPNGSFGWTVEFCSGDDAC